MLWSVFNVELVGQGGQDVQLLMVLMDGVDCVAISSKADSERAASLAQQVEHYRPVHCA